MTPEEAQVLEDWLMRVWRDNPDRPPYAIMAELLKWIRTKKTL